MQAAQKRMINDEYYPKFSQHHVFEMNYNMMQVLTAWSDGFGAEENKCCGEFLRKSKSKSLLSFHN